MTITQLSIFVENKPGKLVQALEVLSDAKVDMRALSLADTADFGILRIIADKPDEAMNSLQDAGFIVKSNDVIAIEIDDRPGGLASVIRLLSDANIDIEYTYAFVSHRKDKAYVILRVENNVAAIDILKKASVTTFVAD